MQRREFFNYIKKTFPEYFDLRDLNKDMEEACSKQQAVADFLETRFLEEFKDNFECPLFDFDYYASEE
jgi:hypothetical protein